MAAAKNEGLITREEAALRLGFSTGELRRRERLGQIKYVKRGAHGTCLYRVEDVQSLDELLSSQKGAYTIQEAQAVFKLLKEGKSPVECVIEGGVRPDAVEGLVDRYAQMNRCLYITADTLAKINEMVIDGPLPIKSENELLEFFSYIESSKCLECGKGARAFCVKCVKAALKKKTAEVAEGDDPDL